MAQETYQIKVKGWLDKGWTEWFDGMQMNHKHERNDCPMTVLTGCLPDQAALRGYLCKLWDLGLTLISVNALGESELCDE